MIYDADGNEIQIPIKHLFGHFIIPENCHIKGVTYGPETSNDSKNTQWVRDYILPKLAVE